MESRVWDLWRRMRMTWTKSEMRASGSNMSRSAVVVTVGWKDGYGMAIAQRMNTDVRGRDRKIQAKQGGDTEM